MADTIETPQAPRRKFGFKEAVVALGAMGAVVTPEVASAQQTRPVFAVPGQDVGCNQYAQQGLQAGIQYEQALQQRQDIQRIPRDPRLQAQIDANVQALQLSQNDCQIQQSQGGYPQGGGGYPGIPQGIPFFGGGGGGFQIPGIPFVIPIPIPGGGRGYEPRHEQRGYEQRPPERPPQQWQQRVAPQQDPHQHGKPDPRQR